MRFGIPPSLLAREIMNEVEYLWLEQYHHERRQPGDKIARSNKELERFQHSFFIPVTLKTL
jgi:hypothetical protein